VTGPRALLVLLSVLLVGCATTGTGTGFSSDAEEQLRSMGPAFNEAFSVDGSSIETLPQRELIVQVRDDAVAALPDEERAARALEMANWIWDGYGRAAGAETIGIGFTAMATPAMSSPTQYRFSADELTGQGESGP